MKRLSKILTSLILVLSLFVFIGSVGQAAYAADETEPEPTIETGITSRHKRVGYVDAGLYSALCRIIAVDSGSAAGVDTIPLDYFKDVTTLDLSIENMAEAYDYDMRAQKIKSLSGLEYLELTNLKTLILDGQGITSVTSEDLSSASNTLSTLSIQDNAITSIDVTELTVLNTLKLSNNKITSIDISKMVSKDGNQPTCELVNNNISKASDIKLSNFHRTNLYLSNNMLYDTTKADFPFLDEYGNIIKAGGTDLYHNVSLLYQGYKDGIKLVSGNYLVATPDAAYPGFAVEVWSLGENSELVATSKDDSNHRVVLTTGAYQLKFKNNTSDIVVSDDSIYVGLFDTQEISVYPTTPTLKIFVDDQETAETRHRNEFQVTAYGDDNAKMYVQVNDGEWHENNTVVVSKRGGYTIKAKTVYGTGVDALTSDIASVYVECNSTINFTWIIVLLVVLIGAIIAGIFLFRWYRAGAQVAPIEPRERRSRRYK